jgi:hypothetical protein
VRARSAPGPVRAHLLASHDHPTMRNPESITDPSLAPAVAAVLSHRRAGIKISECGFEQLDTTIEGPHLMSGGRGGIGLDPRETACIRGIGYDSEMSGLDPTVTGALIGGGAAVFGFVASSWNTSSNEHVSGTRSSPS